MKGIIIVWLIALSVLLVVIEQIETYNTGRQDNELQRLKARVSKMEAVRLTRLEESALIPLERRIRNVENALPEIIKPVF